MKVFDYPVVLTGDDIQTGQEVLDLLKSKGIDAATAVSILECVSLKIKTAAKKAVEQVKLENL